MMMSNDIAPNPMTILAEMAASVIAVAGISTPPPPAKKPPLKKPAKPHRPEQLDDLWDAASADRCKDGEDLAHLKSTAELYVERRPPFRLKWPRPRKAATRKKFRLPSLAAIAGIAAAADLRDLNHGDSQLPGTRISPCLDQAKAA